MSSFMKSASSLTLAAALAATPMAAFAQTASDAPAATVEETDSAPAVTPDADTNAPMDPADGKTVVDGTAAANDPAMTATTEPAAKPVEGQIVMQDENTILASDLIGSRVYSTADDDIGEINDLIVMLDGTVEGAVIGVGGFLGIGEKDVAVEMATLSVTTDDDGDVRLITSATREDLEAAESFVSKAEQDAARDVMQTPADPTAPGAVAPANGTVAPAADPAAPATAN
ncbi:PRC-barrel domain-containing protein [Oceaniglobus indicus]|uniref:PRC-barrel domain-containing protein n=1 Tax=Oceaniglobus indicus TaxID=2047749 RepID=UPI000C19BD60|nr:PRC-barrel domain-containing protein [Oceaniglobus indicus]